ncbi:MarR family winged helix-turn-helix transcriptional regulator [Streptomyces sp. NBC_00102]|uniref:MarR family winged helix-turn-helix transcriptional regulator n=1 Tax=Streptomyces sp. NBC_00102 TaxID=2975652 RepID=UPI0022563A63|nr:MarR family transcriptional regulator [Streptomyces sp. NBC_00102]MCX5401281.1 MarR family transcriptional regulator [Streptomyces sp. NBC_00102]
MPPEAEATPPGSHDVASAAGDIVELLDVLWERTRDRGWAAPASLAQLRLMYAVDRQDGIRMRVLGAVLNVSAPSLSRLCDRLQSAGFVERRPSPDSGREVTLSLTTEGHAHLAEVRRKRDEVLTGAIDSMPAVQRAELAQGLDGLRAALGGAPMLTGPAARRPARRP